MKKILTIIEGRVSEDNWALLEKSYLDVDKNDLPASLLSSHLVQDANNSNLWRIITIWENREAMDSYRKSVETPIWILIFKNAGAEPVLNISEIVLSK